MTLCFVRKRDGWEMIEGLVEPYVWFDTDPLMRSYREFGAACSWLDCGQLATVASLLISLESAAAGARWSRTDMTAPEKVLPNASASHVWTLVTDELDTYRVSPVDAEPRLGDPPGDWAYRSAQDLRQSKRRFAAHQALALYGVVYHFARAVMDRAAASTP